MADSHQAADTELNPQWAPAIHPHFRLQWEEAQNAYVLLYPEGMIKLNFSGGEILSRCDGRTRIEDIIGQLVRQFPEADGIEQDVREFFAIAFSRRWLTHG